MARKRPSGVPQEEGVFYVLTALFLLATLVFIMTLGLKSLLVRQAATDVRFRAEQVCASVAADDVFWLRQQSTATFKRLLEDRFNTVSDPLHPRGYVKLKEAQLIMPDMPDNNRFSMTAPHSSARPFISVTGSGEAGDPYISWNFSSFMGESSSCVGLAGMTSDCRFSPAVEQNEAVTDVFPSRLWNDRENAGNSMGCVIRAEVETFLHVPGHPTEIPAVFAYWRPVRGSFPLHNAVSPSAATMPGLTIAVSTHLTTDFGNARFRFPAGWNLDDPFHDYLGVPQPVPNFVNNPTPRRFFDSPAGSNPQFVVQPEQLAVPDDYPEMLAACANPAVLARNYFLSAILELAVRHGQLRASTEILHVGTQHRDLSNYGLSSDSLHPVPNPPAVMVPFGRDLLRPDLEDGLSSAYQIPYVYYYAGSSATGASDMPAQFGLPKNGLINPFNNAADDAVAAAWKQHNALIAGQLRYCYHLYQCNSTTTCNPQLLSRIFPQLLHDSKFESADYTPVAALRRTDLTAPHGWDQDCPWGIGNAGDSCSSGGGDPASRPRFDGLTASELVSGLGSTQSCPYQQPQPSPPFAAAGDFCAKGTYDFINNITNDLRPDYRALIQYLSGDLNALASPGIFPIEAGYTLPSSAGTPFDLAHYQTRANAYTPILLVTHQLPSLAERDQIRTLLNGDAWMQRPITVVFFPVNRDQANNYDRLKTAFRAQEDDDGYHNRVLVFDPFAEGVSWDAGLTDDQVFQTYWLELIKPATYLSEDRSIMWRAFDIFNNVLTSSARKF